MNDAKVTTPESCVFHNRTFVDTTIWGWGFVDTTSKSIDLMATTGVVYMQSFSKQREKNIAESQ